MKKAVVLIALSLCVAGYVLLQTTAPAAPKLATVMPGGALLYLEAPDFGRVLRDWDASKIKAAWLGSASYETFSHSNLFTKLADVYNEYGEASGFLPDLKSITKIAGGESALALYQIRDVEFLFVSRMADSDFIKTPLWALRDKFEQRQAGGVSFYLRTDPASKRTVAFAFAKGHLLLATRDDLVAQALELLAGGTNPSVASDRWYRESTAAATSPGELRLVMNLDSLVASSYFRSYWIQRNTPAIRQYWAGVADVKWTGDELVENRVLLRKPDSPAPESNDGATVASLLALVPADAGMYKAFRPGDPSEVAELTVRKIIGLPPGHFQDWRTAPSAVSQDAVAGSETDLETRIDEQPLPADAGAVESVAAVRAMLADAGLRGVLLIQSSAPASETFVRTPSVMVLEGAGDWNEAAVRSSLSSAAGGLWTTAKLGANFVRVADAGQSTSVLDGLGSLAIAVRGHRLFVSNDSGLLAGVLKRENAAVSAGAFNYAAGARYQRERPNFQTMMAALDYSSPGEQSNRAPKFFSGNLMSLSEVLSGITELRITEERKGLATIQTVTYTVAR